VDRVIVIVAVFMLSPVPALAEDAFGVRVGGYGFRKPSAEETDWTDCRMDGLGLFAGTTFGDHLFAEVGLDFYQANDDVTAQGGMDRMSSHVTGAMGLRMFPKALISPYAQVGVGAEITQVETSDRPQRTHLFPSGFLGVGSELLLGEHLRLGANVRMHMMAHPDGLVIPVGKEAFYKAGAAGQAQFFARYAM
jgi:hypothetical protein